tara:strand:- start:78 stop:368 length:291 start_codon:yes stop_codon:yes gene_type:complete
MAAGEDALILYTLPNGNQVFLNVNHIVSMEEITRKSAAQAKFPDLQKITMSSGKVYDVQQALSGLIRSGSNASFASSSRDIKTTIKSSPGLSGGKF